MNFFIRIKKAKYLNYRKKHLSQIKIRKKKIKNFHSSSPLQTFNFLLSSLILFCHPPNHKSRHTKQANSKPKVARGKTHLALPSLVSYFTIFSFIKCKYTAFSYSIHHIEAKQSSF